MSWLDSGSQRSNVKVTAYVAKASTSTLGRWSAFSSLNILSVLYMLMTVCDRRVIITVRPSHPSVHRRWPGISRCCRSYLEQSASAHYLGTLFTSLRRTLEGLPLLTVTVKCPRSDSLVILDNLIVRSLRYINFWKPVDNLLVNKFNYINWWSWTGTAGRLRCQRRLYGHLLCHSEYRHNQVAGERSFLGIRYNDWSRTKEQW